VYRFRLACSESPFFEARPGRSYDRRCGPAALKPGKVVVNSGVPSGRRNSDYPQYHSGSVCLNLIPVSDRSVSMLYDQRPAGESVPPDMFLGPGPVRDVLW